MMSLARIITLSVMNKCTKYGKRTTEHCLFKPNNLDKLTTAIKCEFCKSKMLASWKFIKQTCAFTRAGVWIILLQGAQYIIRLVCLCTTKPFNQSEKAFNIVEWIYISVDRWWPQGKLKKITMLWSCQTLATKLTACS